MFGTAKACCSEQLNTTTLCILSIASYERTLFMFGKIILYTFECPDSMPRLNTKERQNKKRNYIELFWFRLEQMFCFAGETQPNQTRMQISSVVACTCCSSPVFLFLSVNFIIFFCGKFLLVEDKIVSSVSAWEASKLVICFYMHIAKIMNNISEF